METGTDGCRCRFEFPDDMPRLNTVRIAFAPCTIEVYSLFDGIDFGCSLSRARFEVLGMYYFRFEVFNMSLCVRDPHKTLRCSLLLVHDCQKMDKKWK